MARRLRFDKVSTAGQATVAPLNNGPAAPPGYTLTGAGATYYDFTTSAVFSGNILVCAAYNPVLVGDVSDAALLQYGGGTWQNVTTSNNSTQGTICGQVTGLSLFAVETVENPLTIRIKPPAKPPVRIRLSKQGTIGMTIVSTAAFDATQIDPATIRLSRASVQPIKKGTKYNCHAARAARHLKNLTCRMNLGGLAPALGANFAVMTGVTGTGAMVQGAEAVKIVLNRLR